MYGVSNTNNAPKDPSQKKKKKKKINAPKDIQDMTKGYLGYPQS